jgi:tetratricopeptide (TPR) repeat protein
MKPEKKHIDLALRLCVLSAALIIPLVFYLDAYEVFELAKSTALKIFGMASAFLLLARGEPVRARSLIPSLLFLGFALLSMLATPLMAASLERMWELASIVALLWAAESVISFRWRIVAALIYSNALVTGYALLQYLGHDPIQWTSFGEKRVYATMGNPDFLAAQNSFLIPVLISLALGLLLPAFRPAPPTRTGAPVARASFSPWSTVPGMAVFLIAVFVPITAFYIWFDLQKNGQPFLAVIMASFILCIVPAGTALIMRFSSLRHTALALLMMSLLLAIPSLFYTQARGAYLGFVSALFALAWLVHRFVFRLSIRQFLSWTAGAGGVIAILVLLLPTGRHFIERFSELRDPVKSSSIQIRLFYWYSGFLMGRGHTLTGAGIGAFHLAGSGAQGQAQHIWDRMYPRAAEVVSPHLELYAHNDYVHLFAELGPLGLGVYLWIMVSIMALGLSAVGKIPPERETERWLAIGLLSCAVSFYVNSLMNFPLKVVPNAHFFYSCALAILLSVTALKVQSLPIPRSRLAAVAGLLALLVLSERAFGKMLATSYLKLGHRVLQVNRAAEALKYFDQSNRLRPVHTDAILVNYYGGKALQGGGDYRGAVNAFTKSIASFPDFPEGHQARGLARMAVATETMKTAPVESATSVEQAVADLARSAWLNPKESQTWFFLGSALRMQGKNAESVSPYIECIRFADGRIPDAYYGLALSYIDLKKTAEARKTLEELLVKSPNFPGARQLLAKTRR